MNRQTRKGGKPPRPATKVRTPPAPKTAEPPALPSGARRLHLYLSGRVQGVGMRATMVGLAPRYSVTGWVRNTPDGRVEAMVEGLPEDLERFLAGLGDEMAMYIAAVQRDWETPTGEWREFSSARDL